MKFKLLPILFVFALALFALPEKAQAQQWGFTSFDCYYFSPQVWSECWEGEWIAEIVLDSSGASADSYAGSYGDDPYEWCQVFTSTLISWQPYAHNSQFVVWQWQKQFVDGVVNSRCGGFGDQWWVYGIWPE